MSAAIRERASGIREALSTSRIVFLLDHRSYAGQPIDELARRAEAAYRRGRAWFFDGGGPPPVAIYLVNRPRGSTVRAGSAPIGA